MLGRYSNKHNGRIIEIDRVEIGDTGTSFWYAGNYDCFTTRELEKHWVQIIGKQGLHVSLERLGDAVTDVCEYMLERTGGRIQGPDGLTTEQEDLMNRLHKFLAIELGEEVDDACEA